MGKQTVIILCLLAVLSAGCSTMGKMTGKAVKGVENAADDFKQGYHKGKNE